MRNPDCVKYSACLDRAAKAQGNFDCEGCLDLEVLVELGFRKDEIPDVRNQMSEVSVRHPVVNNKKQGEEIMEEKTVKVCSKCGKTATGEEEIKKLFSPSCTHKDGYVGVCKKCKNKQAQERKKEKAAGIFIDKRKGKAAGGGDEGVLTPDSLWAQCLFEVIDKAMAEGKTAIEFSQVDALVIEKAKTMKAA